MDFGKNIVQVYDDYVALSCQEIVDQGIEIWMNPPGQRANILDGGYTLGGMGFYESGENTRVFKHGMNTHRAQVAFFTVNGFHQSDFCITHVRIYIWKCIMEEGMSAPFSTQRMGR